MNPMPSFCGLLISFLLVCEPVMGSAHNHRRTRRFEDNDILPYLDSTCENPMLPDIPDFLRSPKENLFRLTDTEAGIRFIDLPAETVFAQSISSNFAFAQNLVFMIIQLPSSGTPKTIQSFVYSFNPSQNLPAQVVMGPLTAPDGMDTDLSIWGTAIDNDGILYVSVYNQNMILSFDLKVPNNAVGTLIVENVPAPNDIALNEEQSVLYIAGGTFENVTIPIDDMGGTLTTLAANPARGRLYQVNLEIKVLTTLLDRVFSRLLGMYVVGKKLFVSAGYDIFSVNLQSNAVVVEWLGQGTDGLYWTAENIDTFQYGTDTFVMSPGYGDPVSSADALFPRDICLNTAAFLYQQVRSSEIQNEDLVEALLDPELHGPTFLNTFVFQATQEGSTPIKIILFDPNVQESFHFEIDQSATLSQNPPFDVVDPISGETLGQRLFFPNTVTAYTQTPNGYTVGVNFEVPRVLVIPTASLTAQLDNYFATDPPTVAPVTAAPTSGGQRILNSKSLASAIFGVLVSGSIVASLFFA